MSVVETIMVKTTSVLTKKIREGIKIETQDFAFNPFIVHVHALS